MSHLQNFKNIHISEKLKLGNKVLFGLLVLSFFSFLNTTFAQGGIYQGEVSDTGAPITYDSAKSAIAAKAGTAAQTPSTTTGSAPVFSGKGLSGGADLVEKELSGSVSKEHDIKQLIISWTNFLLPIATTLAVLAIVWAGFLYITALGDDGNMDKAKNIIIWVVGGLLVIAAAYAIVNFVMTATF